MATDTVGPEEITLEIPGARLADRRWGDAVYVPDRSRVKSLGPLARILRSRDPKSIRPLTRSWGR